MAIPMSDIRSRFIRHIPKATLSNDDALRFMDYSNDRRYGRVNMGQLGYNAQNPSVRIRNIRLNIDSPTFPRR